VELAFSEESVSLKAVNLDPAQMAEEATLTAPERVKLALQDGPLYPSEIAEITGVPAKTVKNSLTGLRKQGAVEPTGEKEGREEQIRIIVPASLSLKEDGTRDDDERPLSDALVPGQSAMLSDLADYKAAGAQMRRSKSGPALALGTYLKRPDDERLKWLTKAVLTALGKDTSDWKVYASAVKAAAEDPRNHPPDCECGECV
jgi:hypothetical protein